jgi:hypothetical protein
MTWRILPGPSMAEQVVVEILGPMTRVRPCCVFEFLMSD